MENMKNLKKLRVSKDLNQGDLAKILNVSPNTISRWESGQNEPDSATLKKIAAYFHVTVDYLLGETDKPDRVIIKDEQGHKLGWVAVIDEAIESGLTPEDVHQLIKIFTRKK
jgi:transcriptional regulator with XRE-family HTH domain